jgi:hypothetical protein
MLEPRPAGRIKLSPWRRGFVKKKFWILIAAAVVAAALVGLAPESSPAVSLEEAISQTPTGEGPGKINPEAEPGFLGIQGAPAVNPLWGLLWAVWVGWIFSTVGAFGGIMAGVGHITIFGLANYAKSFKESSPALNKLVTDSIRVSNQWLVGMSGVISSFNYYRMGRLVLPLAVFLAVGSVGGSLLIPIITAGKIKLSSYLGYFGLVVLLLGCFLIYKLTPKAQAGNKNAKAAAAAFEKAVKEKKDSAEEGVKLLKFGLTEVAFTFYGVEFRFKPILPVIGGFCIAALASFLGIGGGFLLVPFMTAVVGLPMFIVAGTSALAVVIGMVVSIFSYMVLKGVPIAWGFVGAELVGIFIGSMIGPRTSRYIPDKVLQIIFIVLAFYVGLRYTTKGFLGTSIVPPF